MSKIGSNDLCPCGSGIKYKKCYKEETSCKLFEVDKKNKLIKLHAQKEKDIMEFLTDVVAEVNSLFPKKETDLDFVSLRVQLIVCFSLIDVFSSYWYEYNNSKTTTQSIRFKGWVEDFCFTELNNEYRKDRFGDLDVELFVKLRNSLVHFFAIPNGTNPGIVVTPNNFSNEEIKDHIRRFKNRGNNIVYLKPIWVKQWLVCGAKLMLEEMMKNIALAKIDDRKGWDHIDGINRIYEKTQLEGAKKIELNRYNK